MHFELDFNGGGGFDLLKAAGFVERLDPAGQPDGMEFRLGGGSREVVVFVRDFRTVKHAVEGEVTEATRVYEAILPNHKRPDDRAGKTALEDISAGLSLVTVDARNVVALAYNEIAMADCREAVEGFITADPADPVIQMPFCDMQYADYNVYPALKGSALTEYWTLANPSDVYGAPYLEWRDGLAVRILEAEAKAEPLPIPAA